MSTPYDYPLLIGQLLHTALATRGDQTISHGDHTMTYAAFARRLCGLGGALAGLGLGPGTTIAVMDYDSHRYLECFFAVPMLGATLHTVNVRLSAEQILYTINHAEDDAILVHEDFLPLLLPLVPRFTRPTKLILLADRPDAPLPDGFAGEYEALVAVANPVDFADFDENTRATLFYTTGTTGDPKGVSYSHRQLVLHTLAFTAQLGAVPGRGGLHHGDVYMPLTPLFHVHGWGAPYIATFLGLKQVYPGRYDPARLLALIANHGVTFSHCVPTILAMLLAAPTSSTTDLSHWRVIIGGSALPDGLALAARARGIDVHAGYGLSETCPLLTLGDMVASQTSDDISIRTAAGKPILLMQLRVVDPDMVDVPQDGVSTGEVIARAPWLTQGYLKNPVGSADLWRGGWLHTGDVGHMSPDGTLRISDRLKDVIKSGGEWVSSLKLENLVSTVPGLREVAAVGVPDARWGERPVLVLALDPAAAATIKAEAQARIAAAVTSGALPKWAMPEKMVQVDSLPKTSVGKIDKKLIRAALADGSLA